MGELGKALSDAMAMANRPRSLRERLDMMAQAEREEYRRRAPALRAGIPAPARPQPAARQPTVAHTAADARMDREAAILKAEMTARVAGKRPIASAARSVFAFAPSPRQPERPERPRQPEPNRRAPPLDPVVLALVNKVLADRNARQPQALSSGNFTMVRRPGR